MTAPAIPLLQYPFTGEYSLTFVFGSKAPTPTLQQKFTEWGIVGHNGLDFGLPEGTAVLAVDSGTIFQAGMRGDLGNAIIITHSWGKSVYAHLRDIAVLQGQSTTVGQLIGHSGQTGMATGPHLHFGILPNSPELQNGYMGYIDPLPYLHKKATSPRQANEPAIVEKIRARIRETQQKAVQARHEEKQRHFEQIIQKVMEKKTIANQDVQDVTGVSRSTASNYLHELVTTGKLRQIGKYGAVVYSLA